MGNTNKTIKNKTEDTKINSTESLLKIKINEGLEVKKIVNNLKGYTNITKVIIEGDCKNIDLDPIIKEITKFDSLETIFFNVKAQMKNSPFKYVFLAPKLKKIAISDNFNRLDFYYITKNLQNNPILKELNFIHFNILNNTKYLYQLQKSLCFNFNLNKISFAYCTLEPNFFKYLSQGLSKNTSVEKLTFIKNQILEKGIIHLSSLLKLNNSLKTIYFISNDFSTEDLNLLGLGIAQNKSIKSLRIFYEENITESSFFNQLFQENKYLEKLYIDLKNIKDCFKNINEHPKLKKLMIRNVKDLSTSFDYLMNSKIEELDIRYTKIHVSNLSINYFDSLKFNSTLKNLAIYQIDLKEDFIQLLKSLHSNTYLKSLVIFSSTVNKLVLKELADFISKTSTLKKLIFVVEKNNYIDNKESKLLCEAIQSNKSIKCLRLALIFDISFDIQDYINCNYIITKFDIMHDKCEWFTPIAKRNQENIKISKYNWKNNSPNVYFHFF